MNHARPSANPTAIYANILYIVERSKCFRFSDCLGNSLGPVPPVFGGKLPEYMMCSGRDPTARMFSMACEDWQALEVEVPFYK